MKFTPKSDKEIAEEKLLPEGQYPFEISGGEDTTSKAGNDMIKLTVRVFKDDGTFVLVSDYLMEQMLYKIKHACDACGLTEKYNAGELLGSDFIGRTGELKLKIQEDKTGQYQARNSIADYIVPKEGESPVKPPKDNLDKLIEGDDLEDEIPF